MKEKIINLIQEHKNRLEEVNSMLNYLLALKEKLFHSDNIEETINQLELEKSLRLSFICELEDLFSI